MPSDSDETQMRFVNNFRVDECSIPEDMTVAEWRRANAKPPTGLKAKVTRLRRREARPARPGEGDLPPAA